MSESMEGCKPGLRYNVDAGTGNLYLNLQVQVTCI
jgi:hypothetical protein